MQIQVDVVNTDGTTFQGRFDTQEQANAYIAQFNQINPHATINQSSYSNYAELRLKDRQINWPYFKQLEAIYDRDVKQDLTKWNEFLDYENVLRTKYPKNI